MKTETNINQLASDIATRIVLNHFGEEGTWDYDEGGQWCFTEKAQDMFNEMYDIIDDELNW